MKKMMKCYGLTFEGFDLIMVEKFKPFQGQHGVKYPFYFIFWWIVKYPSIIIHPFIIIYTNLQIHSCHLGHMTQLYPTWNWFTILSMENWLKWQCMVQCRRRQQMLILLGCISSKRRKIYIHGEAILFFIIFIKHILCKFNYL